MRGASRASFAELSEQLTADSATHSAAQAGRLGDDLFAVAGLLDAEHGLRRALSDPGKPAEEKAAVAGALLGGKVSEPAEELVAAAARARWASPSDMTDAIEQLAITALVLVAQAGDRLDDLEDELFRFGRVLSAQPELRAALADPALPAERKRDLLGALLEDKVTPVMLRLVNQLVAHPRGRTLEGALAMSAKIAAERRSELIAVVRTAVELSAAQRERLSSALAASYGHPVVLDVIQDPDVLGGLSVQVGDELIDGTAASRLAAVRRRLAG